MVCISRIAPSKYDVKYITSNDFKYNVIVPNEDEQVKAKTKKSKDSK